MKKRWLVAAAFLLFPFQLGNKSGSCAEDKNKQPLETSVKICYKTAYKEKTLNPEIRYAIREENNLALLYRISIPSDANDKSVDVRFTSYCDKGIDGAFYEKITYEGTKIAITKECEKDPFVLFEDFAVSGDTLIFFIKSGSAKTLNVLITDKKRKEKEELKKYRHYKI